MLLRRRFLSTTESNQNLPKSKKLKKETEIDTKKTALNETTRKDASPTKPVILTPPRTSEESDTGSESDASEGRTRLEEWLRKEEFNDPRRFNHNTAGSEYQLLDYADASINEKSHLSLPYLFASSPYGSDDSDSETDENRHPNRSLSSKPALPVAKSGSTPH